MIFCFRMRSFYVISYSIVPNRRVKFHLCLSTTLLTGCDVVQEYFHGFKFPGIHMEACNMVIDIWGVRQGVTCVNPSIMQWRRL